MPAVTQAHKGQANTEKAQRRAMRNKLKTFTPNGNSIVALKADIVEIMDMLRVLIDQS